LPSCPTPALDLHCPEFATTSPTPFQHQWIEVADRLGLDVRLSREIALGGGMLTVSVQLRGYGAPRGMVLVPDFDLIEEVADELVALGYGFSCIGEPGAGSVDWVHVEDILRDWGAVV
jgi:hypothetical protein